MSVSSTHVTDLLPTLLYLQGFPVAEDMRGDVIQDAIRPDVLKTRRIRRMKTHEVSPRPAVWDTLLVAPELDQDTIEKL
jgi:hypothetical protein